ncbi:MAG: hypothetical protein ACFCU5_20235 [Pleurocapsa sp.]
MSQITSNRSTKKSTPTNHKVASSIVHKPFATGKINIFNPPKSNPNGELTPSKLVLNATLEDPQQTEELLTPQPKQWLNVFINPWGISAIALLLLANIFSGILIWRNSLERSSQETLESTKIDVGSYDLAAREFVTLNLNTLSTLSHLADIVGEDAVKMKKMAVEIPPALLPLNLDNSLSSLDTQYHYILTEYTGDRDLAAVKQKVNSVSLVNLPQGLFIYLGAFTQKSTAIEFLEELKTVGITAYIYPFESK